MSLVAPEWREGTVFDCTTIMGLPSQTVGMWKMESEPDEFYEASACAYAWNSCIQLVGIYIILGLAGL